MSTHLRCSCGQVLPLADEAQGRKAECPACGAPQYLPSLASVVALSNARGQRAARLDFEPSRLPESLPFLDNEPEGDDDGYEPPDFSPRRPR